MKKSLKNSDVRASYRRALFLIKWLEDGLINSIGFFAGNISVHILNAAYQSWAALNAANQKVNHD